MDKDDPGFDEWLERGGFNYTWVVTVDGKEVDQVVTADTDEGFVIVNATDANGNAVLTPERDAILQSRIEGNIVITVKDRDGKILWP